METTIYDITEHNIDSKTDELEELGRILRDGGLVAFPTETVYGLGGNALDATAASRIYEAKGRPSDNPLIAHIADMDELEALVENVPDAALKLADKFWPGPLTMIMNKSDAVPHETTGGLDTVAVRMPVHPVARALIRAAGVPVAAPSANVSGRPSPTLAEHVIEDLNGRIDAIIDGGKVDIGIESTIVDLTDRIPVILRPGYISKDMLEETVGEVLLDKALYAAPSEHVRPKAPGMMYRHYAPKGELTIVEGNPDRVTDYINQMLNRHTCCRTGVITTKENEKKYYCDAVISLGSRDDEESIARELYGALRKMDENVIDYIYVESFEGGRLGEAIMNRLNKAAGHRIMKV